MSRIYNLLFALAITATAKAQDSSPTVLDSFPSYHQERFMNHQNVLEVHANFMLASNFLMRDMVAKNYWTAELIDDQVSRLKTLNTAGIEASAEIQYHAYRKELFKNKSGYSSFWNIGTHALGGIRFNDQLIRIILEGNAGNRDISLNDGKNQTDFVHYSTFGFGIRKSSEKQVFSGSIGLAIGHQRLSSRIRSGRILTHENGEVVDIQNVDFTLESTPYSSMEGLGVVTAWEWRKKLNRGFYRIQLTDFGVIKWGDVERIEPRNQNYTYQGFDLTGLWDNDFSFDVADSIDGNYIYRTDAKTVRLTPFQVSALVKQPLSQHNFYQVGVSHRWISGYMPMLSIGYGQYYRKSGTSRWLAGIDAGGFGLMVIRLETDLKIAPKIGLKATICGLESMAVNLPVNWSAGAGLFVSL
ncbi:MAG: hypothetical protein KDC76_12875 [Bacteroidetes bacterium]|nr:hypothetical protein [Bacteroidota bacterium]